MKRYTMVEFTYLCRRMQIKAVNGGLGKGLNAFCHWTNNHT